ncbi:LysM peptidoglycan-binding domain-containing protein [Candidatus Microgenomates bacterium]|nr:LysM peptidoglycan-binding domain-containing protein [Candidatus Microgenomates bacterium]
MVLGAIVVLMVGSLVVSYLKNRQGSLPEELLRNNAAVSTSTKTHTVEKGETLWSIAELYYNDGFAWIEIATENKLTDASVIEVGQELAIPNLQENLAEEVLTDLQENAITAATYEVVKGDNLWEIAVRAYGDGYKWTSIASENNLVNPNTIHAGNVLVLPR